MVDGRDTDTVDMLDPLMDAEAPSARPSFEAIFASLARDLAGRSQCVRRDVGCVITSIDFRQVFAIGYNGGAAGEDHVCSGERGACGCLHAEDNATINCTARRSDPKIVFTTMAPCADCAARLINLGGVTKVYYLDAYRLTEGLDRLSRAGIRVEQLKGV